MQTIRTAILSFGLSGKVFHAPFIHQHPGYELVSIWERTKSASVEIYPYVKIVRSFEEILDDENIDLVIVNTPTGTHYEYAKKVLEAGKHAVVEKAFTSTVEEAIHLDQLAIEKNKVLSVFQNRRWDSDFQTVQKVIKDGLLGTVLEAEFHFDRFKDELSPKKHKETAGPGAGLLYDLGPHLIDQSICLFGMPEAVFADIRTLRTHSQVDDYIDLLLYYSSVRVRLKSGLLVKEPIPSFIVHGSVGSFIKSRADIQEAALLAGEKPDQPNWGEEPVSEMGLLNTKIHGTEERRQVPTLAGNYGSYYDLLYGALTGKNDNPVSAKDGIRVMQILEAAVKSNRDKKVIDL
ncbi:Gfo/Idh/MocA family oxidoreductase [Sediminibacterium goheungense]|uniref:Putative dehydrogenase n=1 Tax=Sediminibacterium goheungense TaxID=1086393 RepID=A0A4R6IWK4_9BACT|nr:Gfo/Idh/MocA family oxidoreductase [Sediminibacterium goheungense]TDO27092.1 putative dehydrogenase [Sediminibacterium goheungense]